LVPVVDGRDGEFPVDEDTGGVTGAHRHRGVGRRRALVQGPDALGGDAVAGGAHPGAVGAPWFDADDFVPLLDLEGAFSDAENRHELGLQLVR
jgi:hypothetical protein